MQANCEFYEYFPPNAHGIPAGKYTLNQIVQLLRDNKNNPEIIQYIADMLEE